MPQPLGSGQQSITRGSAKAGSALRLASINAMATDRIIHNPILIESVFIIYFNLPSTSPSGQAEFWHLPLLLHVNY